MNWLPRDTVLGRLSIEETFEEYDGPRLFSCTSASGNRYVAAWAEESNDHDLWLYVPVSPERFQIVRSGGISVRSAFINPEDYVFLVKTHTDPEFRDTIERILKGPDIADEWLPDNQYRLELKTDTAPRAVSPTALAQRAKREMRPMLRLEIDPRTSKRTAAPTRAVGSLLVHAQNLLDTVGQSARLNGKEAPLAGRIPVEYQLETASEVIELSAASFVIDLASTGFNSLFDSPFEKAANAIVHTLALDDEDETFKAQMKSFNTRAAKSFRTFVQHLDKIDGPVTIVSANESANFTAANMSTNKIKRILATLNYLAPDNSEPPVEARMRLFRGDVDNHTFGAENRETGETYSGYVDSQALPGFLQSQLNADYDMVVAVTSITDDLTNQKKFTYRLMQIGPPAANP
ncbi:hypothetical protein C8K38_11015 [Rhodococcus sp. OK611]|uniref:DUF6575 domain-containing protein n=1 Tax=unclassified Rhodococcus (in: high G+C Gram-positive bacteria) TaxID=192944 RepID=UPI000BC6C965|nr:MULTISPECIES: DUF6575 domain-containing protein [unclassified Rhodococcus (in: high G+C Gram-positive bacteria)]PTR42718.1 hypothetical protein C8K38_11015 [Rhodococcus sp. OK611]SNX91925.1 hypothetical protein SAMN05447004_111212 [Rhodococcus sp. OK270]